MSTASSSRTIHALLPKPLTDCFPNQEAADDLWASCLAEGLEWKLAYPFQEEGHARIFDCFVAIYAWVPAAKPVLLDMLTKTHGYKDCFGRVLEAHFRLPCAEPEILEGLSELEKVCLDGGASFTKPFGASWKGEASAGQQLAVFEKHILNHMSLSAFFRTLSLGELEKWYGLLAIAEGLEPISVETHPLGHLRLERKRAAIFEWIARVDSIDRAVALSVRDIMSRNITPTDWLPLEDVITVFGQGSLERVLSLGREANDAFRKRISKLTWALVDQQPDPESLLRMCSRSTLGYWRKAGYIDKLTWYRLVGATGKQIDQHFSENLGL